MTAATFDMFDFVAELIESGVPEKQANAYAKTYSKAQRNSEEKIIETVIEKVKHDYRLDDVATKLDIKELELQIALVKKDIEIVKSDLQRDIQAVRTDIEKSNQNLIKWIVGSCFTLISVIFMMLRFFDKV